MHVLRNGMVEPALPSIWEGGFMSNLAKVAVGAALLSVILGSAACNSRPNTAVGTDSSSGNASASGATSETGDTGTVAGSGGLLSHIISSSQPVSLPADTVLHITVDQTLSSAENHGGDPFDASISQPVVVDGKTVISRGARVRGRVIEASSSGRLSHPGELRLALTSVEVEGKRYDLKTSSIERQGASHETRNVELIGGGAGVGGLIGAVAGHGKGAVIGAAAGAGAGTAGAAATGKKDVTVPAETRLSFRLVAPITIAVKN
jgi:hypothetical protein